MTHDIVDWLLAIGSIAAIIYSSFGVYTRTRRDSRLDALTKAIEETDRDIAHIEGFLTGISNYRRLP